MIGKSCKKLLIINFLIFYNIKNRAKNSKKNLTDEFIDFFVKYSRLEKLSEEQDFSLRCGLGLFQAYIEFLNKSEEKIKAAWNLKIKPFLLKQYPIQKSGIFNVNADVEFLMKEIDKINTPEKEISESDKSYIKSRLHDIRINTIYISSKHNMKYNKTYTNINYNKNTNNNKINISNNISNNKINPSNKVNNNNISNNNMNKNNINKILDNNNTKEIESNKPFDLMKKELVLNMELMKKTKQQKKNIVVTIEKEFDILDADKKRNNSIDEQKSRTITLAKPFDPYKYVQDLDNNNNNDSEINKKKIMLILPEKKQKKVKEISPNYIDEHETENTIKYKNKDLKMISIDLFLKYIITSDFLEKYINYIYYFSQQCFCFTQKEALFQKIINCYTYYKKLNSPFFHLKKIIYFLDLLIIEMYEYYHSVPLKGLSQVKKFYHNLENDIKKKLGISNKDKNTGKFLYGEEGKKVSSKINEKVKLMGQMVDRLKSNPNIKIEKGKIKEESLSNVNNINNIIKNEKDKIDIKNPDEHQVLEEIKQIVPLFDHEQPNYNVILNLKKSINFYNLKAELYDNKNKKKNKLFKKSTAFQRAISFQKNEKINKKNMNRHYFSITDWNPKDIGEALIAISKRELIKIERKELYKAIFLKKVKDKTCPNIMECITQFNKLTSFIMEEILSYDLPKERAKRIEAWIKVAEYLKIRKDHNDCVAIYSALKHYIITGLKLTMKEIKSKTTKNLLKDISDFCSFEGNYKNLRIDMINCLDSNEFYIPYLGMLLRDISFYEANYEYLINGNLINIEKIEKVQNTIDNFFAFKNIPDLYNKNNEYPQELDFFNNLEIIKEDDLDILANKLEPKFILRDIQQKQKRLTNIDKIYFSRTNNSIFTI